MIILTNSLTQIVDEGAAKVANNLIRRIKKTDPSVTVLSCGVEGDGCDVHIPANKLLLNGKLAATLWRSREQVLYVPTYARMLPTAARVFLLSLYTRRKLRVLLPMKSPMGGVSRCLFRLSGAGILCLSEDAKAFYRREIGKQVQYIRTGVDTERFVPVDAQTKQALRQKYGIPQEKPVVLHVGHMSAGRNVGLLAKVDERFHKVLVVSAQTDDPQLRSMLKAQADLTLIETYQPHIEELYQLADVYLFPVEEALHCIDVPLSALEAAACGVPVVTTAYGEMARLIGQEGFYHLTDFASKSLGELLLQAMQEGKNPREAVLPYDWSHAVQSLLK